MEITPEFIGCPDLLHKEELVFVTFFRGRNSVKTQIQETYYCTERCLKFDMFKKNRFSSAVGKY